MDLRCQHCGERIIARGFGKCPGCNRDLPADLQLSPKEKELEEMEETWRAIEERSEIIIFPPVFIPKEKEREEMEDTRRKLEESRRQSGGVAEGMGPSSV